MNTLYVKKKIWLLQNSYTGYCWIFPRSEKLHFSICIFDYFYQSKFSPELIINSWINPLSIDSMPPTPPSCLSNINQFFQCFRAAAVLRSLKAKTLFKNPKIVSKVKTPVIRIDKKHQLIHNLWGKGWDKRCLCFICQYIKLPSFFWEWIQGIWHSWNFCWT